MTLGQDYVLCGMNPAGYHLTSILIHSANAVLLYFLALGLLRPKDPSAGPRDPRVSRIGAAIAALVFAVHPLRVESVVWITERRDVVSGFFYLATLVGYLRYVRRDSSRWYWISLGLFVAALLSKGTAVTAPAVLLMLNVFPLRRLGPEWRSRSAQKVYRELAPFVALAAGFVVLTFVALQPVAQLPIGQKAAVSAFSLVFYLWKSVVPAGLVPLYDMPAMIDPLAARYVACYAIVLLLCVGAWFARKKYPGLTTAWILFVGILLPLLGVHQNGPQIAADRYTYNAAPVLAILVAAGWMSLRRPVSILPLSLLGTAIALLGTATWRQTAVWRDSDTLWAAVLDVNPRSATAWLEEGNLATKRGVPDSAIVFYQRSLETDPGSPETENNLGIALSQLGRLEEARTHFERATRLKANYYEAENNLGLTIANLGGSLTEAIAHYQAAISMKTDYADARVNWGNALVQQGRFEEAIARYREALSIRADNADAELNWGVALARENRFRESVVHFDRALALRPGFGPAQRMRDQAVALRDAPRRDRR
jgi:tetratricopeptide (TPR) repeat protein